MPPKTPETTGVEAAFAELAAEWHKEADFWSFSAQRVAHWAYRRIVAMGEPVLPLIFREMEANGGDWFDALETITGENPVTKDMWGQRGAATKAWLDWAREHGYRW